MMSQITWQRAIFTGASPAIVAADSRGGIFVWPKKGYQSAYAVQTTQKRLELSTSAVTGRRSNQLSHWAIQPFG